MRRIVVLVGLVVAVSACGGGSGTTAADASPIVFGVTGGNLIPFQVTIRPDGKVRASGRPAGKRVSSARLRRLRQEAQLNGLSSRDCPGTLPDVASRFIRRNGRTVTVHGGCEPRFQRLWNELAQTVGLQPG